MDTRQTGAGMTPALKIQRLRAEDGSLPPMPARATEGAAGFDRMQAIMQAFRGDIAAFGGKAVQAYQDYLHGLDGLPPSDVIKFHLADHCSVVVRPSGTEPKLKAYISVSAENRAQAEAAERQITADLEKLING